MQIPSGDLVPRRSGGWSGYRRRRAARRRRALVLAGTLLLLAGGAYAGARALTDDGGDAVRSGCTTTGPTGPTRTTGTTGPTGPQATPNPVPLGPPPTAFRVRVLNATGRDGLAAEVGAALRTRGYRVSGTGNAPAGATAGPTVVRYGGRSSGAAKVVADAVGPRVPAVADERIRGEVQLVLGRDFRRLATPQEVAARAAARATAAAAPPPRC